MKTRQTPCTVCPYLWLLSDARNDAALETCLRALPGGSGFVFRHYHLEPAARRARFDHLAAIARSGGHCVILAADSWSDAEEWGADGLYGAHHTISGVQPSGLLWLATAHNGQEIAAANRHGADGIFLSPVFATRSHPGGATLGLQGFHILAQQSQVPVIALGGMTADRAEMLGWPRWGAIDGWAAEEIL